MSYTIAVRVHQKNSDAFFRIVEKTVWHDATWSEINGEHVFEMGYSGTSGTLRFRSDKGTEDVVVAVGVHNYKRWCDIVPGLTREQSGLTVNTEYYNGQFRAYAREKQLSYYSVRDSQGRLFEVNYTVSEGNSLRCDVTIH